MTARDEFADDIYTADRAHKDDPVDLTTHYSYVIADELIAAGYSKPRTISTVDELDALPRLSVIRSDEGAVFEKHTMWHEAGSRDLKYSPDIALPATVLQIGWGEE